MTPHDRRYWTRLMGARRAWWDRSVEAVIDPALEVVDAHLHLWEERAFPDPTGAEPLQTSRYLPGDFDGDGHRVMQIVYVECGSGYSAEGPEHLRPVGESTFAARMAALFDKTGGPMLAACIAHADLTDTALDTVLDAHLDAARGLLRGVRQSAARLDRPGARLLAGAAEPGLYARPEFRHGLARLAERGLTFDAFVFHHQLDELRDLARAVPSATIIVNHLGGPVGYDGAGFVPPGWRAGIAALAECPNMVVKLGGAASLVTGYDAARRALPPQSETFVVERGALFRHAIGCFGPERCMFESNFPVDSTSISYGTLWNAYKRIASEYGAAAQARMLSGTARAIYRLPDQAASQSDARGVA